MQEHAKYCRVSKIVQNFGEFRQLLQNFAELKILHTLKTKQATNENIIAP